MRGGARRDQALVDSRAAGSHPNYDPSAPSSFIARSDFRHASSVSSTSASVFHVTLTWLRANPTRGPGPEDGRECGLGRFLAALPTGPSYAVELRTPALLTRRYAAALEQLSGALGSHHDLDVLRTVTGDDPEMNEIIDRRVRELEETAFALGQRVYAEDPAAFRDRIRTWWQSWRESFRD